MIFNLLGSFSCCSACHSALKAWQTAIEDALICVTKDPSFIKGYYRLATAYTEIGNYDDAISVLQTALTKDPGNKFLLSFSFFVSLFDALIVN